MCRDLRPGWEETRVITTRCAVECTVGRTIPSFDQILAHGSCISCFATPFHVLVVFGSAFVRLHFSLYLIFYPFLALLDPEELPFSVFYFGKDFWGTK